MLDSTGRTRSRPQTSTRWPGTVSSSTTTMSTPSALRAGAPYLLANIPYIQVTSIIISVFLHLCILLLFVPGRGWSSRKITFIVLFSRAIVLYWNNQMKFWRLSIVQRYFICLVKLFGTIKTFTQHCIVLVYRKMCLLEFICLLVKLFCVAHISCHAMPQRIFCATPGLQSNVLVGAAPYALPTHIPTLAQVKRMMIDNGACDSRFVPLGEQTNKRFSKGQTV